MSEDDVQDLLWHGERLCRALDRAGRAERRALELEAAVAEARATLVRCLLSSPAYKPAVEDALGWLTAATRRPQDAPEPPALPDPVPTVPDVQGPV